MGLVGRGYGGGVRLSRERFRLWLLIRGPRCVHGPI